MKNKTPTGPKGHFVSTKAITNTTCLVNPTTEQITSGCVLFGLLWLMNNNQSKSLGIRSEYFTDRNVTATLKHMTILKNDEYTNAQVRLDSFEKGFESICTPLVNLNIPIPNKPDLHITNLIELIFAKFITKHNFFYEAAVKKLYEWRLKVQLNMVTQEDLVSLGIKT